MILNIAKPKNLSYHSFATTISFSSNSGSLFTIPQANLTIDDNLRIDIPQHSSRKTSSQLNTQIQKILAQNAYLKDSE